jgi:hypothetical protein
MIRKRLMGSSLFQRRRGRASVMIANTSVRLAGQDADERDVAEEGS